MDNLVTNECRKYTIQLFKWLKIRYPDNLYDYLVLEDNNIVSIKIVMNSSIKFYEKRGIGILRYIIKTFRYPQYISANWRYNRNMFNIVVICGRNNNEIH